MQRRKDETEEECRARNNAYARSPEQREKRRLYMLKWRHENPEQANELARQARSRWSPEHAQKVKEAQREYMKTHREVGNARSRKYYAANPDKTRDKHLRGNYGITLSDYNQILIKQNGVCAGCGATRGSKTRESLCVDHDHVTGRVRGLLCIRCNVMLGWLEKRVPQILKYLEPGDVLPGGRTVPAGARAGEWGSKIRKLKSAMAVSESAGALDNPAPP